MNYLELMKNRESCRSFDGRGASREALIKIIEAGRLSPSGCNAQPWKFVVVDEDEALEKLRDALVVEGGGTGAPWRDQVASFISVVETPANVMPVVKEFYGTTQRFAQGDLGMAVMNMLNEATELGLSTCVIGMCDQKKMQEYFGVPEGCEVRMTIAVGYAAEKTEPREKVRKSLEEICGFNRW